MVCEKCSNLITLSAMSIGICKGCCCQAYTPHIPTYKVCKECSEKYGLCEQCGKEINNNGIREVCEVCGKEISEGTGDEFLDRSCGYRFWLCDGCIDDGDYY